MAKIFLRLSDSKREMEEERGEEALIFRRRSHPLHFWANPPSRSKQCNSCLMVSQRLSEDLGRAQEIQFYFSMNIVRRSASARTGDECFFRVPAAAAAMCRVMPCPNRTDGAPDMVISCWQFSNWKGYQVEGARAWTWTARDRERSLCLRDSNVIKWGKTWLSKYIISWVNL